jgi:hypothetical protein
VAAVSASCSGDKDETALAVLALISFASAAKVGSEPILLKKSLLL